MLATQSEFRGGVEHDRAGEPADGNQALELGVAFVFGIEVHDGDGVLRAVGDVECFAIGGEGQGIGRAPKRSEGLDLVQTVSTTSSFSTLMRLRLSLPAFAQTTNFLSGETASAEAWRPVRISLVGALRFFSGEIDDGDGAFAGDMADRIDADFGPAAGGSGEVAFAWATAAPVGDVGFVVDQHDVVRCDADVEGSQLLARFGV